MFGNQNKLRTLSAIANSLADDLAQAAPKNTGALAASFQGSVNSGTIEVVGLSYADIVSQGINGKKVNHGSIFSYSNKMPPISALVNTAKQRGINVFALQKSIFDNGFAGTGFIDKAVNNNLDDYTNDLGDAVWDDFVDESNKKKEL